MNKSKLLAALLTTATLAGCASNEELYARYDALCAPPAPPIIVMVGSEAEPWQPAVYFGVDVEALDSDQRQRLDDNIALLKAYPALQVSVRAFTDQLGRPAYNKALAERRLASVVSYMTQQGINRGRLKEAAVGQQAFINQSDSVEARIVNRRVEMLLLDPQGRPLEQQLDIEAGLDDDFTPPLPVR